MSGSDSRPPAHGRGALSRPDSRFLSEQRSEEDDGWYVDRDLPPLRTSVTVEHSRTIITRNKSPDIPFDQSINPMRGCEHGCIYCYARPSHAYLGLSPGLDFETVLFVKPDAPTLLARELSRSDYRCQPIAIGTNTDPYQPAEREWRIMRGILEVLRDFNHPVSIVTKSALVMRDLDILAPMAAQNLVHVSLSLTTLDAKLARAMEPRASAPAKRLAAIKALAGAGVPVGVMTAPMIPGLNDHELERLLEEAAAHGAGWAGYVALRMPHEIKDLFAEWLRTHYPLRAEHVLSLIREIRDGKLNDSEWGDRMRGTGPYAQLLAQRFRQAVKRLGLDQGRGLAKLDCGQFRGPPKPGDQLSLL
jgi:DNA repair photolyase